LSLTTLHSDESKQARKRKVEAEWDQGVEEIKRLRVIQNNTETIIDKEEEGGRTLRALYKGPTANFASIGLDASNRST
jgi:hypothetical protein